MLPELTRTWANGWAVSRRTPAPVDHPWGLYLEVNAPGQVGRHVITDPTREGVRAAAATVTVPDTWLKVPADPELVAEWLPEGWVVDFPECGHLMATDLVASSPTPPAGYTATLATTDDVVHARVSDHRDEPAARGQQALLGGAVVVDRVSTEPAHRRRGLGGLVMRSLADDAVARGAVLGVLGATDAGRALYETLGWRAHSRLSACVYRPSRRG
ncbi:GNAT family N-acetyltransferase [Kitasatospora viridis]|uniref:FR47-like protein n=1 Tax=Kitasatospora viridis TaxID=281105 RepID=A0A561SFE2_9ACTN|nr:GNAT family N-acetyltransferase [Kitasatospora viridis]TWF73580.1 FR47-like protein [Kitasatospora viridis]